MNTGSMVASNDKNESKADTSDENSMPLLRQSVCQDLDNDEDTLATLREKQEELYQKQIEYKQMEHSLQDKIIRGLKDEITILKQQVEQKQQMIQALRLEIIRLNEVIERNTADMVEITQIFQQVSSKLQQIQSDEKSNGVALTSNRDDNKDDDLFQDYKMKNGLVLIICITKYIADKYDNLQSPKYDMDKLKDLWQNKFGYHVICNEINPKYNNEYYVTKDKFMEKLDEVRLELRKEDKKYDGLILNYSGHGFKRSIVMSDGTLVKVRDIKTHFSAKNISIFKDKPKIYIFDACRSNDDPKKAYPFMEDEDPRLMIDEKEFELKGNKQNKIQRFYHPFLNVCEIYGNTDGYGVSGGKRDGGSLIVPLTKHLSYFVDKHKKTNILNKKSFRQLLNPVRIDVHSDQFGNQAVEISDTFCFELYINVNQSVQGGMMGFMHGIIGNPWQYLGS